jgi:formamidopyrimidine-DNA glycosylase
VYPKFQITWQPICPTYDGPAPVKLYVPSGALLGQEQLQSEVDVELFWSKVSSSKKSLGAFIMDHVLFHRAEIIFKAGIHPDAPGKELGRQEFDHVWAHTVALSLRVTRFSPRES